MNKLERFVPHDNTDGEGGYVYDCEKGEVLCFNRTIIFCARMAEALHYATPEEMENIRDWSRVRKLAYRAGVATQNLVEEIRRREKLNGEDHVSDGLDLIAGLEPVPGSVLYEGPEPS